MVQYCLKSLHQIKDEIARWRKILEVPYQEHTLELKPLSGRRDLYSIRSWADGHVFLGRSLQIDETFLFRQP
jgi:hypothetical protein